VRNVTLLTKDATKAHAQSQPCALTSDLLVVAPSGRDVGYPARASVPTRTLESHASRVRRKLAAAGLPGWIVNVWGVGYKLRHVPIA